MWEVPSAWRKAYERHPVMSKETESPLPVIELRPMMPVNSPRFRALLHLVSLLIPACAAEPPSEDYPRTETVVSRRTAAWSEADRPESSPETKELEARLYMEDPGRLIANSIRAHGGWDAWRSLRKLSYVKAVEQPGKEAAAPAPAAAGEGGAARVADRDRFEIPVDPRGVCPCGPEPHPLHPGPPGGREPLEAVAVEHAIVTLPFSLVSGDLGKERLGVELDPRSGELLEKLKVSRKGGAGTAWMVVYFDAETATVKRVLRTSVAGPSELAFLSEDREVGGIRISTRREVHELRRQNMHVDRQKPGRIETVTDVVAE